MKKMSKLGGMLSTHVYSDFLVGTELRPIPRLSKAQTSTPAAPPPFGSSAGESSSLGITVPARPLICGPQESWVPANPDDSSRKLQSEISVQNSDDKICRSSRKLSQTHEIQWTQKEECALFSFIYLWWEELWSVHCRRFCRKFWFRCCRLRWRRRRSGKCRLRKTAFWPWLIVSDAVPVIELLGSREREMNFKESRRRRKKIEMTECDRCKLYTTRLKCAVIYFSSFSPFLCLIWTIFLFLFLFWINNIRIFIVHLYHCLFKSNLDIVLHFNVILF